MQDRARKWREQNRERDRATRRQWYAKNKAKKYASHRRWVESNPRSKYLRMWRALHQDQCRSYKLKYLARNPEKSIFTVFDSLEQYPGYERHLEHAQLNPREILIQKEEHEHSDN